MPCTNKWYRYYALALVPALLGSGSVTAATKVNASLMPPAPVVSGQTTNPTPVAEGPAGTFSFIATVCNNNGPVLYEGLKSQTHTLTNGNVVLNRVSGTGPGVGSVVNFPATGQYADNTLAQGECVAVPYQIGLQSRTRFTFLVDFWSAPQVTIPTDSSPVSLCGGVASVIAGQLLPPQSEKVLVGTNGAVKITAISPTPVSYDGPTTLPFGCTGDQDRLPVFSTPQSTLTLSYDCTCP